MKGRRGVDVIGRGKRQSDSLLSIGRMMLDEFVGISSVNGSNRIPFVDNITYKIILVPSPAPE